MAKERRVECKRAIVVEPNVVGYQEPETEVVPTAPPLKLLSIFLM